jgi:hypothetical protein
MTKIALAKCNDLEPEIMDTTLNTIQAGTDISNYLYGNSVYYTLSISSVKSGLT